MLSESQVPLLPDDAIEPPHPDLTDPGGNPAALSHDACLQNMAHEVLKTCSDCDAPHAGKHRDSEKRKRVLPRRLSAVRAESALQTARVFLPKSPGSVGFPFGNPALVANIVGKTHLQNQKNKR